MTKNDQLVIDPEFSTLLIPLRPDERTMLEESLFAHGCLHALIAWRENNPKHPMYDKLLILDGNNRHEFCTKHSIQFKVETIKLESREMAKIWIRRNQLGRRNLPDDARAMAVALLYEDLSAIEKQERARKGGKAGGRGRPKNSLSATVAEKLSKDKKDNLAELAKQGKVTQHRVKLAQALKKKAVDVMGEDAARRICDDIQQGRLSLARTKRDLSKAATAKKLDAAKKLHRPDKDRCKLREMRMEQFLPKFHGVIDAIITDPPYPKEYLPLYGELARLAATALKPNGVLAVMCGQSYLPEILAAMTQHLKYRTLMVYLTPGPATAVWGNADTNSQFKPILIFGGEKRITDDVVRSKAEDKTHHDWGQSVSGMSSLVERLSDPDQLVCDPFLGAGTTAVACLKLHRRVIGCDIDAKLVKTAENRCKLELDDAKSSRVCHAN